MYLLFNRYVFCMTDYACSLNFIKSVKVIPKYLREVLKGISTPSRDSWSALLSGTTFIGHFPEAFRKHISTDFSALILISHL